MKSFRDLEAYKTSKKLAVDIYSLTKNWPKDESYGLTSQIRRSSVSIAFNLAEGCGRASAKDTLHFLAIARGSCYELEAQIDIAHDLHFVETEQFDTLLKEIETARKLLSGLINRYQTLIK
jgi:four helix bundle protein